MLPAILKERMNGIGEEAIGPEASELPAVVRNASDQNGLSHRSCWKNVSRHGALVGDADEGGGRGAYTLNGKYGRGHFSDIYTRMKKLHGIFL
jgi:hypothetical protein